MIRTPIWFVLLVLFAIAPTCFAQSLDFSVLGLFPKETSDLGYADLKHAREQDWFPQFQAQLVPVALHEFEQFLAAAQMKQAALIEQVAWSHVAADNKTVAVGSSEQSGGPAELVVIANGEFDVDAITSFLDSHKIASISVGNLSLYASGTNSGSDDIYFVLIDARTIALGPLKSLQRMLSVHAGDEENLLENEKMMELIAQANGNGIFWGVLSSTEGGHVLQRLLPQAALFPQAQNLIAQMNGFIISVRAPSDIEINLQAVLRSPQSALLLSQVLQAGLLYQVYQQGSSNPDLAHILAGMSVAPSGNMLQLSINLSNDQVRILIERNTFNSAM